MLQESSSKGPEFLAGSPTGEELQSVRDLISALLIAMKNYALYPEDHTICQRLLGTVSSLLTEFLAKHDKLKFDVEKDRLLYRTEVVHQGSPDSANLAFLLFRDGIHWLEFQKGLELWEINDFLKILNEYREPPEEGEGDLVTALWEAEIPHLLYRATDVYWEAEPLIDFSLILEGGEGYEDTEALGEEADPSPSIMTPALEPSLWKLTPKEMAQLREMILEEEKRDNRENVLDLMSVALTEQCDEEDFSDILRFLKEEFRDTLAQGKFHLAHKLLQSLCELRESPIPETPWVVPLLEDFFKTISRPQVLGVLEPVLPTLDPLDMDRVEAVRKALLLLLPEAIPVLATMLPHLRSSWVQRQLLEVIASLAKRDLHPLEEMLRSQDEAQVERAVSILGGMPGVKPTQILLKTVEHPSEKVRKQVVRALLTRDSKFLKELFYLIDDHNETIRHLMLGYLERQRSEPIEALLLNYLEKKQIQRKDHQHILDCYRALGRCGSSRSIPFIRRMLFDGALFPSLGRSAHRQGAVIALNLLDTGDAKEILAKASRSLFPSVRLAYRRAMEIIKRRGEGAL